MKYLVTVKFVETSMIEAEVWVEADSEQQAQAGWSEAYYNGDWKCMTTHDSSIISPEVISAEISE